MHCISQGVVKCTKCWACVWSESFQDSKSNLPSCSWNSICKWEIEVQKTLKHEGEKQTLSVFLKDIYPLASSTHIVANYDHTVIFWTFTNYSKYLPSTITNVSFLCALCPLEHGSYNFRHTRFKGFLRGWGNAFMDQVLIKKIETPCSLFHTLSLLAFSFPLFTFNVLKSPKHNHFVYQKIGRA